MRNAKAFALLAVAGLCAPGMAQDSVSSVGTGLPGDALSPYDTGAQCANYVVDLAPLTTSMGNVFGVAPILKSPKTDAAFFNNLISAQTISPDYGAEVDISGTGYALWENTPGAGINPQTNSAPGTINGPTDTVQFAAGFSDFNNNYSGVVGAFVNYASNDPNRLYVARHQVNVNGANINEKLAAIGGLVVDAYGNFYFRADDFGLVAGAGFPVAAGQNLYRTRMQDRNCGALEIISGNIAASAPATDGLLINSATTHGVPNMVPASIAGANGRLASGNFNDEYVYGATSPLSTSTAHFAPGFGGSQRGAMAFTRYNLLNSAGAIASHAMLAKDTGGDTNVINVFTVNAAGAPIDTLGIDFNAVGTISDPIDGFAYQIGMFPGEFDHYHSQTNYNGGVSQVALKQDQAGRGMCAAVYYDVADPTFEYNSLLVSRWDPANPAGTLEYAVAAYVDIVNGYGKGLMDSNGMFIGRQEPLANVTGGSPNGPSMSAPAMDSVGNIWFIGSIGLFDTPVADPANGNIVDYDSGLIRAIYDPANFGYRLELVAELGTVLDGQNSGVPYQIAFMGIADSNSISSGTMFSSNANELAFGGFTPVALDPADPKTNGGVVVNAKVVYDVDGDQDFDDPTSSNGDPLSLDEAYNVLLYVGYYAEASCKCDIDGNGTLNLDDINLFAQAFTSGNLDADMDDNGTLNLDDINLFAQCFVAGCP